MISNLNNHEKEANAHFFQTKCRISTINSRIYVKFASTISQKCAGKPRTLVSFITCLAICGAHYALLTLILEAEKGGLSWAHSITKVSATGRHFVAEPGLPAVNCKIKKDKSVYSVIFLNCPPLYV